MIRNESDASTIWYAGSGETTMTPQHNLGLRSAFPPRRGWRRDAARHNGASGRVSNSWRRAACSRVSLSFLLLRGVELCCFAGSSFDFFWPVRRRALLPVTVAKATGRVGPISDPAAFSIVWRSALGFLVPSTSMRPFITSSPQRPLLHSQDCQ